MSSMNTAMPRASRTIEACSGNSIVAAHSTVLTSSRVRTGRLPSPIRATSSPPTITPADSTPHSSPQAATDIMDRP